MADHTLMCNHRNNPGSVRHAQNTARSLLGCPWYSLRNICHSRSTHHNRAQNKWGPCKYQSGKPDPLRRNIDEDLDRGTVEHSV